MVTFHHHDVVGSRMARKRLQALRFDTDTIDAVATLIELHLRFFGYAEGRGRMRPCAATCAMPVTCWSVCTSSPVPT